MKILNIELKIGQKIDVMQDGIAYVSKIQDINENFLLIDVPTAGNRYFITYPGRVIEFYVPNEKDVTKCRSIVLGKKRENNIEMLIISLPDIVERVQRREYFRLPISMEVSYVTLPPGKKFLNLKDVPSLYFEQLNKALTLDISGGGIKILAKEKAQVGSNVLLILNIPEEVILLTTVVRVEEAENKFFRLALKYENIDEKTRDIIIRFIFNKMREQIKLLK
ncbi:c-di-GMP-binding flagellar brake protein YcgR, contains PilZNR and PilZ domains [Caloramator fervidus]|uniref:C-di-GMP-binding flagellar brake protein YcgR, contains PilZNR and PilZ domains n=1 Tax=Caloramator fervidus TaxID=29344 RepID=A0A1H5SBF3_9CLOT|nr:flagellar brake domain-containing protein [Caloramator fervidus]SEF47734.1 c-di-GMP-binding flagellar brake protein YcgR, contains PilZNR and PilZ domains [Caloramator fervidus]